MLYFLLILFYNLFIFSISFLTYRYVVLKEDIIRLKNLYKNGDDFFLKLVEK